MNKIIYISSPNSQQIHVWNMDHNESIKLMQTLNTPYQIHPIILHPNKKILYAGSRPIPKIITFNIKTNGYLEKIQEFTIPSYSTHLDINMTGTILYSASYKNNSLSIIKLSNLGNCVAVSQVLTQLMGCHSSKIETNNKRLWIPCLKEDCIRLYRINHLGTLNQESLQKITVETCSGPRHMVFNYSYNYVYLMNELNSNITVIKIHESITNLPTIIQTINVIPKHYRHDNKKKNYWGSDIHITPNNQWIYCSDRYTNIISYLKIMSDNKLKFKGYQPTEIQPRGFTIDNQGKYLFVAGEKSNFFSIYKIDNQYGKLQQLSRFPVGEGPVWIAILN